jgi:tape measure domain-containing protein
LQAVGQDAKKARNTMEEFGNAVALVGGGKQEFSEVMVSLRQILSTGSVDMTNLKEIASRIPQFLSIAQSLDRSSAPKFVEAAVEKLKQLPRAAVTAQEALSNLDDAWKKKYIETSDGALVANVKARVQRSIQQLEMGGAHTAAAKLAEWWGTVENAASQMAGGGGRVKLTDLYETSQAEIARRNRAKQEAEDAKKTADEKALADKAAEGLTVQEELTGISSKQLEIEEARAEGNEERLAQLEQELRMMTEGKEIMEKTGLAAEVVADHLQRRADNEKEIERLQNTGGQGAFAATAKEDMEIARLRSRGKNKQADKMEADRAERQRVEQLMKEGGLSEREAKKMASGERQISEDTDYLSRTGGRRIRGAVSDRRFTGLDDYHQSDRLMGMVDEWNFDKLDAAKRDRRNRPLKSQLDREAGKPSITPDKFSGMTIKQADEMLEVLRAIRSATEGSRAPVADKTQPRN